MFDGFNYKWEYSFKNALEKTNNTYCRKIKAIPSSVTGPELKRGLKHYNRILVKKPKQKKQPVYRVGQKVRHLLKHALDPSPTLWKSYQVFRDVKTHAWSKQVFRINKKKRKGYTNMYLVNNKFFYPWQLQVVTGQVIKIEAPKPKIQKVIKLTKAEKKKLPKDAPVARRRGSRIRKQTVFYGR